MVMGPVVCRNIDRVGVRSRRISLTREVVARRRRLAEARSVGWRIEEGIVLNRYAQSGGDPNIFLSRRFAACEGAVLDYGAARVGALRNGPKIVVPVNVQSLTVTLLALMITVALPKLMPLSTTPA